MWGIVVMLTVGWMPGYLVFNATGPKKYMGKNNRHFSPSAVLFDAKDYWLIVQSDIAFALAAALLVYCIHTLGTSLSCYVFCLGVSSGADFEF